MSCMLALLHIRLFLNFKVNEVFIHHNVGAQKAEVDPLLWLICSCTSLIGILHPRLASLKIQISISPVLSSHNSDVNLGTVHYETTFS